MVTNQKDMEALKASFISVGFFTRLTNVLSCFKVRQNKVETLASPIQAMALRIYFYYRLM